MANHYLDANIWSKLQYENGGLITPIHKVILDGSPVNLRSLGAFPAASPMDAQDLNIVTAASNYNASYAEWRAFNGDYSDAYGWVSASTFNNNNWIACKLGNYPVYITQIRISNRTRGSSVNGPTKMEIYSCPSLPANGASMMATVRADPATYRCLAHWQLSYATSGTSLTSNQGFKTLTTQSGLAYLPGDRMRIVKTTDSAVYMECIVISYSSTTLQVYVYNASYTETQTSWTLSYPGYHPSWAAMPGESSGDSTVVNFDGKVKAQYLIFNPYDYSHPSNTYVAIGEIWVAGYPDV